MGKIKISKFEGGTKERLTLIQFLLTFSKVPMGLKEAKELIDELVRGKEIELEINEEKRTETINQLKSLKVDFE